MVNLIEDPAIKPANPIYSGEMVERLHNRCT